MLYRGGNAAAHSDWTPQGKLAWSLQSPQPTADRKALIDITVRRLKDAGVYALLDCLEVVDAAAAFQNWITGVAGTVTGTPTLVADSGTQGDGTNTWGITTDKNPSSSTNFALNGAVLFYWSLTDDNSTGADCGSGAATRIIGRQSGNCGVRLNTSTTANVVVANSAGFYLARRTSSSTIDLYKDGVWTKGVASTSTAITSSTFKVGFAATSQSARRIPFAGFGGILTDEQVDALYSIMADYIAAIGAVASINISIADPSLPAAQPYRIMQHGRVTFRGLMVGSSKTVEVQVLADDKSTVVTDWTSAGTFSTGAWTSGNISVPRGGPYHVRARLSDLSSQTSITAAGFYVGEVGMVCGESLGERLWKDRDSFGTPNPILRRFTGGPTAGWVQVADARTPQEYSWRGDMGGEGSVTLTEALSAADGDTPVGLITEAIGGTRISQHKDGGESYPEGGADGSGNIWDLEDGYLTTAQAAPGWTHGWTAWFTGINNSIAGTSPATFEADYETILSDQCVKLDDTDHPFHIAILGNADTNSFTDATMDAMRLATWNVALNSSGDGDRYFFVTSDCPTPLTKYHWAAIDRQRVAARLARSINFARGLETYSAEGPAISTITAAAGGNVIVVNITPNGSATMVDKTGDAAGLVTGFSTALVAGAARNIVSAQLSSNTVRVTVDGAAFVAGQSVSLRYGYGMYDNTNGVYDTDVPDGSDIGFPLQPGRAAFETTVA